MQMQENRSGALYFQGPRMAWFGALVWTMMIGMSLLWNAYNEQNRHINLAKAEARTNLNKDTAFRLWATTKGGFYIPVSESTRPNPYLAHISLRDVKTTTGTMMTLINPATVIREVGEQFQELNGVQAKITNDIYLNPINAPDAWDLAALERFRQGEKEIFEIISIDGKTYLRLAQPMNMEPGCLKCHSGVAGEIGGTTGVSIPLERYLGLTRAAVLNLAETHAGIWILGLGLIGYIGRRNRQYETEREAAVCQLRKLSRAVEVSASAIMITNELNEVQFVNEKFCEITGYTREEVSGKNSSILKSAGAASEPMHAMTETLQAGSEWKGEVTNRKKDGTTMWCLESISSIVNDSGDITHFVVVMEDINERKKNEETILQLAYFDPLTELPNRRNFYERIEQLAASCRRSGKQMALFYLDLDSFKGINDNLGHGAGDELLKVIAQRLSFSLMRETDIIARLGGDEFAVIIPDTTREIAATVAERLLYAARQQVTLGSHMMQPTISVGISLFPNDSSNLDELVKFADIALYKAKDKGKNTYCFYS